MKKFPILVVWILDNYCITLLFIFTSAFLIVSLWIPFTMISNIFSNSAYAHINNNRIQQWISPQQNVKIEFTYEPEKPLLYSPTELKFSVQNLKTGEHLKELFAKVMVMNTHGFFNFNKVAVSNSDFFVNSTFPIEGTYQVILRIDSKDHGIALASFKIFVPFQPIGTVNLKYVTPLILPTGIIGVISVIVLLASLIVSKRKFKRVVSDS